MEWEFAAIGAVVLAPGLLLGACVTKGTYDAIVGDATRARAALAASESHEKAGRDAVAKLQHDVSDLKAQVEEKDQDVSALSTSDHDLQTQLDEQTVINAKLRAELERLGKNVDAMLREKGTLAQALDDAKGRLDELRRAQAATEARAELFQKLVVKFKSLVDAGQLKVATRGGRLVLELPNDVLFDSGQTALKPTGAEALEQIGRVLTTVPGRTFQVAGDTDNVPIETPRFPSNWELSTARAVEVVKLLIAQGVDPHALSAAGYGEFDPVSSNDTPEGRARNRRIEITLQPNLDELATAPEPT